MAATATKKKGQRKRGTRQGKAPDVLARQTPRGPFPSDEQSIEYRRVRAEQEQATVKAVARFDEFFGAYEVRSQQWPEPYRVEIRSLNRRNNTCSCRDYQMNRLGTCKHIERVLQHLAHRRKRRFARAAEDGSPKYEIFLDTRPERPVVRLARPGRETPAAKRLFSSFYGADDTLLADPLDALPSLLRSVDGAHGKVRQRIRVSEAIPPWLDRSRGRKARERARASFLQDVRAGKRTLDPVRLPLYPYQQEGMLHLAFGERAMLADDMGLGKTVQAIAACELLRQTRRIERVLVVSPASLKAEWDDQIRQFSGRDARLVFGSRPTRLRTYRENHFYFLMNYEQVRIDVEDINRQLAPDVVILDEAQRIKNWPTKTAKTIKRLRSPYAFVLTGTPLENRIEELYSLVEFLDPQLFGSLFRFQREFLDVDDEGNLEHRNVGELHRRVSSVMMRRRKDDVEGELPPRTVSNRYLPMEEEQRARYDDYDVRAKRLIAQAEKRPLTKEEFEWLQQLLACMRMICDTPYILDQECRVCPKLGELESILGDVLAEPETKVIIFSEWVRMLDLVKELAAENGFGFAEHTGRVDQRRRREEIRRFKEDPDCRLFLSSESGGTGLNLQVANVVINLDLPWNPARLEQRIARAWRKHQTRPVNVINLVTESSIEHAMLGKLAFKARLAEAVVDGRDTPQRLKSGRGRKAFLEQVNELMGGRAATEEEREKAGEAETTAPERVKQDLAARFPSHLLRLDVTEDRNTYLVVARDGDESGEIRETVAKAAPEASVEVLDPSTFQLLERLQRQGLIAFSEKAKTLFNAPELGGASEQPPEDQPKTHGETALAHLATGARKDKMARLLAGGELYEEALPPLTEAFEIALDALYIYYHGEAPRSRPVEWTDPRFAGKLPGLEASVFTLQSRLNGCDPQGANTPQVIRETIDAIDVIEAGLAED